MIITRKSDYAIRILRALQDGRIHNVSEICGMESVPRAFAYKILRELEEHEIVRSERGNRGGYLLNVRLEEMTLLDVIRITESTVSMVHCLDEECGRNTEDDPCLIHREINRIQSVLEEELRRKTIRQILSEQEVSGC